MNDFLKLQEAEQRKVYEGKLDSIVQAATDTVKKLEKLSKDIRKVREDLRNMKNLRPLKEEVEG